MMKTKAGKIKRMICSMLAAVMMIGLIVVPAQPVQAAVNVPEKLHYSVGGYSNYAFRVEFEHPGDRIANLSTSGDGLKAMVTTKSYLSNSKYMENFAEIGIYARKKGTYTLSFDICNSGNETLSSHSVKVYVKTKTGPASKSVVFDGTEIHGGMVEKKASGKLSVTLNKGYTLNKIVLQTYDKNGKQKLKTVKNNSKITLGKYAKLTETGEKKGDFYRMQTSLMAETIVMVYYTDQFTKKETYFRFWIYRPAV